MPRTRIVSVPATSASRIIRQNAISTPTSSSTSTRTPKLPPHQSSDSGSGGRPPAVRSPRRRGRVLADQVDVEHPGHDVEVEVRQEPLDGGAVDLLPGGPNIAPLHEVISW
jgi:hypothetical protein